MQMSIRCQLMSIRCQLMSNNSHHLKTTEKTQQKWCWVLEYIMCMQYGWYVSKKHVAGSYTPRNHSIWFLAPVFDIFWFASEISVLELILRGRKWIPMWKLFYLVVEGKFLGIGFNFYIKLSRNLRASSDAANGAVRIPVVRRSAWVL